jgi:hypothetical protein
MMSGGDELVSMVSILVNGSVNTVVPFAARQVRTGLLDAVILLSHYGWVVSRSPSARFLRQRQVWLFDGHAILAVAWRPQVAGFAMAPRLNINQVLIDGARTMPHAVASATIEMRKLAKGLAPGERCAIIMDEDTGHIALQYLLARHVA